MTRLRLALVLLLFITLYGWHVGRRTQTWAEVPSVVAADARAAKTAGAQMLAGAARFMAGALEAPERWIEEAQYETRQPAPAAPAPEATTQGDIRVFFGPAPPEAVNGMHNHFLALLQSARESILCALYEYDYLPAAEVLVQRHRAGVRVMLVTDSDYAEREALQVCLRAGIPVRLDERSALMHNKFCVVDGVYVWTGSANITDNGFYRNNNNAVLIASPELAWNFRTEFEEMWQGYFGAGSPQNTPYPVLMLGEVRVATYFSPEDGVQEALLTAIGGTTQSIDFLAFSFTSQELADAMAARIQDGVRVRGIFETRNAASPYSRDEYLAMHGAEVYLDSNPYQMHHKVMVLDGETVVTGSYNFSRNAETQNDENVLIITDAAIAAAYTAEFEAILYGTR